MKFGGYRQKSCRSSLTGSVPPGLANMAYRVYRKAKGAYGSSLHWNIINKLVTEKKKAMSHVCTQQRTKENMYTIKEKKKALVQKIEMHSVHYGVICGAVDVV